MASALLQAGGAGASAYRGRYASDPEHARRMQDLFALLPRARERLAAALGRKAEALPAIPVGVADRPLEHEGEGAFTEGDPRRPFEPIVVLFAETLALDVKDPEEMLVHELAHAVLLEDLGIGYGRLPAWVREGLSNALAGEFPGIVLDYLEHRLAQDPEAFLGPEVERYLEPVFARPDGRVSPEIGLALSYLEERAAPLALRQLIDELRSGRSLDDALIELTELSAEAYLEAARAHALGLLLREREAGLGDIKALEQARREGPAAIVEAAEAVLSREAGNLARGHALLLRAAALEALGEHGRALAAHDALLLERRRHRQFAWTAFLGRARMLAALGRLEEARSQLRELELAGPTEGTEAMRREVRAMLAGLEGGQAGG